MTEQNQIRVDPARCTEVRCYGRDQELVVLFRRTILSPDQEDVQPLQQLVPSACISLTWEMAVALRDLLAEQIKRREATEGPIKGNPVQFGARIN